MDTLKVLTKARELIADEEDYEWYDGPYAAIHSAARMLAGPYKRGTDYWFHIERAADIAAYAICDSMGFDENVAGPLTEWALWRPHTEILAAFDQTIAAMTNAVPA